MPCCLPSVGTDGCSFTGLFHVSGLAPMVKPGIEIMAALPTVILGFLAGCGLRRFVEENLAGVFAMVLVMPAGYCAFRMVVDARPMAYKRLRE